MAPTQPQIDLAEAQQMLDDGFRVQEIAVAFGVSTEAVYLHIRAGRLKRR